ncbi:MAG: 30S ribosomal protein S3 [Planctomycetes bacterium]|nr:30S ribosomal protein S3 [Planctomycetota bacterium]
MGQKVNPTSLRLGIVEDWRSRWYATKKDFKGALLEDYKIRKLVKGRYKFAGIPKIEIERKGDELNVILNTARPGLVIGRKGAEVDKLRGELETMTGKKVNINIVEVSKPELDAQLVGESIAEQLQKRSSYRRTMKKSVEMARQAGAKGIKIICSGRLGGAEIARRETQSAGSIPLHTLRAVIDYGFATSITTYGVIGVKVWIYKGMVKERGK